MLWRQPQRSSRPTALARGSGPGMSSVDAMACEVLETERISPSHGKPFTAYRVQVQRRSAAVGPETPEYYVISKRFSEFKALREILIAAGAEPLRKVPFPSRKLKNSTKVARLL